MNEALRQMQQAMQQQQQLQQGNMAQDETEGTPPS